MVIAPATVDRASAMAMAMALIMVRKSIVAMGAAVGTVVGTTTGANSEDVSGNVSGGFSIDHAYREVGVLGSALRWPFLLWCTQRLAREWKPTGKKKLLSDEPHYVPHQSLRPLFPFSSPLQTMSRSSSVWCLCVVLQGNPRHYADRWMRHQGRYAPALCRHFSEE